MELARFESEILLFIQNNLRLDFLTGPMRVFSWFGNTGRLWIVVTLALLIPRRSRRWGLASAFGLILSLLVCNRCLKPLVARIRPYETLEAIRLPRAYLDNTIRISLSEMTTEEDMQQASEALHEVIPFLRKYTRH